MNVFLRQMAVLGVLTTLAEHLLPDGGLKKAGRMVMGLLMMLTILTSLLQIIKMPLPDVAGIARFQQQAELAMLPNKGSYRDTVLQSLRRQVEDAAQRAAVKAGFSDIAARAELSQKGDITALRLVAASAVLPAFAGNGVDQEEYRTLKIEVAKTLSISESLIHVEAGGTAP